MSLSELGLLAIAAVVVFWAVGAYNRLVRLRNEVGSAFAAVATQLLQRDALLHRWADAMHSFLEETPTDDLLAACERLRGATERAKPRPHADRLIGDMHAAEEAVAAARTRLAAELPIHAHHISSAGAGLAAAVVQVNEALAAADTALSFSREQFNERVHDYNDALLQFPTVLIASLFGFRAAGAF